MPDESLLRALSREYNSFYLYDEGDILARTARLKAAFPFAELLYSVKCNPHPEVLRAVFGQGFGADAASAGEVELALAQGVAPGDIFYSAPGKSRRDIERVWNRATIIADSLNEIALLESVAADRGERADIGVRLNPATAFGGGPAVPSKFGIDEEQLLAFLAAGGYPHVRVTGIHIHQRSQELDAGVIAAYHRRGIELAARVEAALGEPLAYINLGSGIGIPYAPADTEADLTPLARSLRDALGGRATRVLIETGRYAVGPCGSYVTRVMDRKLSRGRTFILLHNTLNGFSRPSLARLVERYAPEGPCPGCEPLYTGRNSFSVTVLAKPGAPLETVDLVGNLCTAADVVAEGIRLPRPEPGDAVVIRPAGAYAATLSPMGFSSQDKPAELFLRADGTLIRP